MPSSKRSASSKSVSPRVRYLTPADVSTIAYKLAEHLFSEWLGDMPVLVVLGGAEGAGRIEGILQLPRQTAMGRPAYPTLFDKTACIFRSMILNHPFMDGNKRMAVATTAVFLDINGQVLCAADEELVDLAITVAAGHQKDLQEIADWFRQRTLPFATIRQAEGDGTTLEQVRLLPGDYALWQRPLMHITILEAERDLGG